MNTELFTNNNGLRLITEFEGEPRLKARLCEGGKFELGYGITFYPDGSPVKEGDTCTPEKADGMFRHALGVFEDAVISMATVKLNENQFSALVAFAYNVGVENLRTSTVLREVNAGRFYDAAAAFGMWIFATKNGYKQALRGLLRRRYAEACLFLGYDWTIACENDAIALTREPPVSLPGRDVVRYKTPFKEVLEVAQKYPLDVKPEPTLTVIIDNPEAEDVRAKSFEDLVAELPPLDLTPEMKADPPVSVPVEKAGAPEPQPTKAPATSAVEKPAAPMSVPVSAGAVEGGVSRPPPPVVAPAPKPPPVLKPAPMPPVVVAGQDGVKPPSPNTVPITNVPYKIDPTAGLKPMEETDRWKASIAQNAGMVIIRLARYGAFGTGLKATADVVEQDGVLMQTVQMGFLVVAMAVIGYTVRVYGDWKRKRAEDVAGQAMF